MVWEWDCPSVGPSSRIIMVGYGPLRMTVREQRSRSRFLAERSPGPTAPKKSNGVTETCCEAWLIDYISTHFKLQIHILPFIGVHSCAADERLLRRLFIAATLRRSAPPPCCS